jgi:hypothetical protein
MLTIIVACLSQYSDASKPAFQALALLASSLRDAKRVGVSLSQSWRFDKLSFLGIFA